MSDRTPQVDDDPFAEKEDLARPDLDFPGAGDYMDRLLLKANGAGLLWEVVYFALWHMKRDPDLTEEDALELGFQEWVK